MNYYEVLGVDRNVTAKELDKAYLKLARKWHPDLNRDNLELAEKKMTAINVAYSILSNEVDRHDYDKKLNDEAAQSARTKKSTAEALKTSKRDTASNATSRSSHIDLNNINSSFESFFGFNPKTKKVINEDKLNTFTRDKRKS